MNKKQHKHALKGDRVILEYPSFFSIPVFHDSWALLLLLLAPLYILACMCICVYIYSLQSLRNNLPPPAVPFAAAVQLQI